MPTATSSTTHELWFNCPYAHYLYTRALGTGIAQVEQNIHTQFGSIAHTAVEGLATGKPLPEVLNELHLATSQLKGVTPDGNPRSLELYWLGAGLALTANYKMLPMLRSVYEIISVEQEITFPLSDGVMWCTRPDLILKRQYDGSFFNGNIKSTSYLKDLETNYEFSVQMLMEAEGVKKAWNLTTGGSVVIALNKGRKGVLSKADREAGKEGFRMESPFTYTYYKGGKVIQEWKPGASKVPVWEIVATPEDWYGRLEPEVLSEQCLITTPIVHSNKMDYHEVVQDIVTVEALASTGVYPKHYNSCNSFGTYRKPCEFRQWCWGTEQERADNFVPRKANHPYEEAVLLSDSEI